MGLLHDIREEWTCEGIKRSLREDWPMIVAVTVSGFVTPVVVKRLGWGESNLAFFLVYAVIWVLVGMATGSIKRRINK